jgi:hypothetical protein
MKSLLHVRVVRVQYLKHRVKFKTSCVLSLTMSFLKTPCRGLSARVRNLLAYGGKPNCMFPSIDEPSVLLTLLIGH